MATIGLYWWGHGRMPLYLNYFTGCAIDNFVAACYNGITRKGKEGKHDVVGRKQRKSSIGTRISLSRAATKAIHTASMRAITTLGKTISWRLMTEVWIVGNKFLTVWKSRRKESYFVWRCLTEWKDTFVRRMCGPVMWTWRSWKQIIDVIRWLKLRKGKCNRKGTKFPSSSVAAMRFVILL